MHFGFSYMGLIFLILLFVPNLLWTKYKPQGYEECAQKENRILLLFERVGEAAVTCLSLIFSDFNPSELSLWLCWLIAAILCMALYEIWWIRYFKSARTLQDFYRSLLGVPVAGATLPVLAFFLLSIYGRNLPLGIATVVLGIGHIGIHLGHRREFSKK